MIGLGILGSLLVFPLAAFIWSRAGRLSPEDYARGEIIDVDTEPEVAAKDEYTIVSYNIGYGSGLANNTARNPSPAEYTKNLDQISATLRGLNPDFVALQEIDYASKRSHYAEQLTLLGDALRMRYRARAYNWDCNYLPFPYWPPWSHFGALRSGQVVLSRFPVQRHTCVALPKPAENSAFYNAFYPDRLAHIVDILVGGHPLTVVNVHLEAYKHLAREEQAKTLVELLRPRMNTPMIVLGDFNAVPPWTEINIAPKMDARLGDRPLDAVVATLLSIDGLAMAIPQSRYRDDGEEKFYTFRSDQPRVAIDHIFVNRYVECLDAYVVRTAGCASDHLPIAMRFRLKPTTVE